MHGLSTRGAAARRRRRRLAAAVTIEAILLCGCAAPPAPEVPHDDDGVVAAPASEARRWTGAVGLALENDIFAQTDRHYTNGVRMGLLLPPWRSLEERAAAVGRTADWGVVLGQQIFTPEDIETPQPIEDDRPYAGWLYAGIVLRLRGGDPWNLPGGRPVLDTFELDVGVVGPWSLADTTQRWVHEVLGGDEPGGWEHQVREWPALQLSWLRQVRLLRAWLPLGLELDLTPHVGVNAGTILVHARAGATLRLGWQLPEDFGGFEDDVLALPLPLTAEAREPPGIGAWLLVRLDARASIFDVLLENSPLQDDGPAVRREPLWASVEVGLVVSLYERVMLGYTHTIRSPEFQGQVGPDAFGSVFLQVAF